MHIDVAELWRSMSQMANGFIALVPRLVLGAIVFSLFILLGSSGRSLARRYAAREASHDNLALALGRISYTLILAFGLLVAVTVAFPSFTPKDLLTTVGFGGVAIGFAFKDIFQNLLAGILILITRPFHTGDQIIFQAFEGTVEDIQMRATLLRTYDGRRVVIPNSDLYTNSVTVNTARPTRRMQYDFGIGYGDDIARARKIILGVLTRIDGVLPDPKADVIVVDLAGSTVNLRARWWSDSQMADVLIAQDRVLTEVKNALTAHGIDLPFPTQQILFHDQTESTDGDRRAQREGWPAGQADATVPERAGIAATIVRRRASKTSAPA